MYLLRGVAGYLALLILLGVATHAGALIAARVFGTGPFQWFSARPAEAPRWRRFGVRWVSAMFSLVACVVLAWAAIWAGGTSVPTTTVSVLDGPASKAGMRNGDRVLSIDGSPVNGWDELRSRVLRGPLEKRILIERAGQRLLLVVERSAEGTIGVRPTYRQEAIGAWQASRQAAAMPISVYGAMLGAVVSPGPEPVQLKGPIGIVRATESQQSGTFVMFLAVLGMTLWPWVLGVHLFDAGTLGLFMRTHSAATAHSERVARLCRLHQALALALVGSLGVLGLGVFLQVPLVNAVVLPFFVVSVPAALSLYPVVWITGRQRWQGRSGWLAALLASATLIPCVAQLTAIVFLTWLRSELRREDFEPGWFSARPREAVV